MEYIKFKNPSFRRGFNATIRLPDQKFQQNKSYEIQDLQGNALGQCSIIEIYHDSFENIEHVDLEFMHDKNLEDYNILLNELKMLYPGFEEYEHVMIIIFVIDYLKEEYHRSGGET